VIFVIITA
jgi:hypothetical protein